MSLDGNHGPQVGRVPLADGHQLVGVGVDDDQVTAGRAHPQGHAGLEQQRLDVTVGGLSRIFFADATETEDTSYKR